MEHGLESEVDGSRHERPRREAGALRVSNEADVPAGATVANTADIEAALRREDDPSRRTALRVELWKERQKIQTEKKYAQLSYILQNLN